MRPGAKARIAGTLAGILAVHAPALARDDALRSRFRLPIARESAPAADSDFGLNAGCHRIAGAVPSGPRPGRKRCEARLALARDIAPGLRLEIAGKVARERARGTGPLDLGTPNAQYAQDFTASLAFAGGLKLGGGYFAHDGWRRGAMATVARQMNVGDEEARRGLALDIGWSRTVAESGGRPLDLALVVDRASLGSLTGDPHSRRATEARLALDTRF